MKRGKKNRRWIQLCLINLILLQASVPLALFSQEGTGEPYCFSTLAGSRPGYLDGPAGEALLISPEGIDLDQEGNIYVTEFRNNIVRKISITGEVTTLAGKERELGSADGPGEDARFNRPHGLCVTGDRIVYVCDMMNSTIRKITADGIVSTVAGIPGELGNVDGDSKIATFNKPEDIAINSKGYIYVADTYNYTIREISPAGIVRTFAGAAGEPGSANGAGSKARFNKPIGIAIDRMDNLFVADSDYDGKPSGNCLIRKITPAGKVTTYAGIQGQPGHRDGKRKKAQFNRPVGIAVVEDGTIYIADSEADLIRKITPDGVVKTIGGGYLEEMFVDGPGALARFADPQAIAVDRDGRIYIADTFNNRIRMGVAGPCSGE